MLPKGDIDEAAALERMQHIFKPRNAVFRGRAVLIVQNHFINLCGGQLRNQLPASEKHRLHAGMEYIQNAVLRKRNIQLDHIRALTERDLIGSGGIAGNVSARGSSVGNNDDMILCGLVQLKAHNNDPL